MACLNSKALNTESSQGETALPSASGAVQGIACLCA